MDNKNKTIRYTIYALMAILVATMALPLTVTPANAATTITVTVNPTNFAPGTTVLVNTNNFTSGSAANIYLSSNGYATISSTDILLASNVPLVNGAFSNVNVTVPSSVMPGTYYVKVYNGQQVGVSSPLSLLAPPAPTITLRPTLAIPGTTVTVTGSNFPAVATGITIYFIGSSGPITSTSVTGTVSSTGTFSGSFVVPSVNSGDYTVLAVATSNGATYGASAPFQVIYQLAPELTQWDGNFKPSGKALYSVLAGQAGLNLTFFGQGLPAGSVQSVAFYNSAGQQVTYGILPPTSVGSNGEFVSTHLAANGLPKVNVTLAGALMPGVGYYAVFTIGGIQVKSEPFIASVPTNGLFNACMGAATNPYTCTSSASSSGSINTLVQGYGFGAGDTVTISIVNGGVTLTSASTTADANGAIYVAVSSTTTFPEQTANVVVIDHLASGQVQKTVGTYSLVPQFTVTDTTTGAAYGAVGDTLTLTGLSFPAPFEASSITFTSMSNGYSVTYTKDSSGNYLTIYFSAADGNFPATSSGTSTTLNVLLPELPGGKTSVTLTGATTAGASVSFTAYFWVNTKLSAAYYVNITGNSWASFLTPQNLFSGDIIDIQATGYPVSAQASVNFTAKTLTAAGMNIMGSTALSNGFLELVLYVPSLPASTQSGFGPYTIVLNGASSNGMLGQQLPTTFQVNVILPGQYSSFPAHVYVNPSMITPESALGPGAHGVFPTTYTVGSPLNIVGVGFTGSAKEYVYISATVSGSTTYQLINTVNTSIYGTFDFTVNLPNESSYIQPSPTSSYTQVIYSVAVYQYNPSAIIQSPSTSTITMSQAVPFSVMPSIMLSPDSGTPNTTVTVVGTGWASGEFVVIYMQTFTIVAPGAALVNSNGFFTTTFSVPAFSPGPVTVVALGSSGVTIAIAPFFVNSTTPPAHPQLTLSAPSPALVTTTEEITLTVTLNGQPLSVPLSSITGTVVNPDGVSQSISFLSVSAGVYQAPYLVPNITGTYVVTATVTYGGQTYSVTTEFNAVTQVTIPPPPPSTALSSTLSSIIAAEQGLASSLNTLQGDLSTLSSQVQSALSALGSSISALYGSISALNSRLGSTEAYSLGALVIAFIALIVIIYGVFVRRMP
ncbi:hypothetical protein B9Q08_01910 [Candidatus Marsarchaeota G2 archaeon ECH_B_SAG-M15]|uniref:IPT/TIG domain-containing protein n=1 Tax=Candidatus Marsarchaeota G2 archaeon ECH_B_SAG-M15 TaxID=1978162 RepID=A0A2R6B054_9ARCH|nr:MAG: hypothetical protein B9Q08_01910 [Candidatus Marsarchaeota G2 archaeon ECH_B_SAG-M15]